MVLADNRYSRFVQFAKIALPLLALGLLSTLFLFSRSVDLDEAIPMVDVNPEEIAREQLLTGPRFSGVASNGSTVTITAKTARPNLQDPTRMSAQEVFANIETVAGTTVLISSTDAQYDGTANQLDLMGGVRVSTSTGVLITTQTIQLQLDALELRAPQQVIGTGPLGEIEAGSMTITAQGDTHLLEFENGVRLVYDPRN